jgi:hypothetical protein
MPLGVSPGMIVGRNPVADHFPTNYPPWENPFPTFPERTMGMGPSVHTTPTIWQKEIICGDARPPSFPILFPSSPY